VASDPASVSRSFDCWRLVRRAVAHHEKRRAATDRGGSTTSETAGSVGRGAVFGV
jgi:hypothetical protein